jgi:hypothetical protein
VVSISDSDEKRIYDLREPIKRAWAELGVKAVRDGNGRSPLGIAELMENWKDSYPYHDPTHHSLFEE